MAQMTFLQIVQRAYRESGLSGAGPQAVTGQVGRNSDFVEWAKTAYEEIQLLRGNWNFDWAREQFTLTADVDEYDPTVAPFGITGGVKEWVRDGAYVYRPSEGLASRLFMGFIEWEIFRELPIPKVPGLPNVFSVQPDSKLRYYPAPNEALIVVHEYWRNPETLVANTDVPRIPANYHMAIMWKTVMLYAEFNKDWSLRDTAEEKYERVMDLAYRDHQPAWTQGGAMA